MRLIHLYQKNRPHLTVKVSGDLEQRFGVCEKRSGSETLDLERWRFNLTVLYKLHFLKVLI